VVGIDEGVGPKPLLQFLPCDHFAVTLEQNRQHLEWLAAEFQLHSGLAQFSTPKIDFEVSEL
jgi:hypothetical protein